MDVQAGVEALRAGFMFGWFSGVATVVAAYAAFRIWQDRRP